MASAPSRKYELGLPHEDMEDILMSSEMAFDDAEYNAKCKEEGPAFPVVVVRQRKTFRESFDKLVSKGCYPEVLFRCLHYLLRSELREASCRFPRKREIRSLEASLRKGVEEIRAFEEKYADAHSLRVLSHCVSLQGVFSSRRRHTRYIGDWSSDVCSSDLGAPRAHPGRGRSAPESESPSRH